MGYYNILLTDAAKKMHDYFTICKVRIKLSSNGIMHSPDIFQEKMSALIDDFEFVIVYLDDFIIITLGSFDKHSSKAKEVMKQLQWAGLKCKIDKCKFSVTKVEYLGYIITQEGTKPDPRKTESVINIEHP